MSENDNIPTEALEKLDQLQAKLHRVRFDLPVLLRGLAHLDETDNAHSVFNKTVHDTHRLSTDVGEFCKLLEESSPYLAVAQQEKKPYKSNETQDATNKPNNSRRNSGIKKEPNEPTHSARDDALATQRSIQSLIGGGATGSMDDPITLDESSLPFVKF